MQTIGYLQAVQKVSPPSSESKSKYTKEASNCWLLSILAYSSPIKMKEICSFETSVNFCRSIRDYIPDDDNLYSRHCENCRRHDNYVWPSCTIYISSIERKIECDLQHLVQTLNVRCHRNTFNTVGKEDWYLSAKFLWANVNHSMERSPSWES
jgi:hypothetical protein